MCNFRERKQEMIIARAASSMELRAKSLPTHNSPPYQMVFYEFNIWTTFRGSGHFKEV